MQRYVLVWVSGRGAVYEHRYVMEQYLGRRLAGHESVHHRNGNKKDNRIENLELCGSAADHYKHHRSTDYEIAAQLYQGGMSTREVAAQLGVSNQHIGAIVRSKGLTRSRSAAAALNRRKRRAAP